MSKDKKGQSFLQKYIQRPLGGLVDAATLGYTDFDKKGDDKVQKGIKRGIAGFGDILTQNRYDFDKKGSNAKIAADQVKEFNQELGDPFNRQQYNRDFRNMLLTDTALRDFEMRREKQRNLDMFRQTMPLVDIAAETAAQRRLMEDRSSPTKISQQILRARQGEAALMNALANQTSSAAAASAQGIGPRGRAGGR